MDKESNTSNLNTNRIKTEYINYPTDLAINQYDDHVFQEFREKYKRSLEAISSLKEILELKQNFGIIKHSYSVKPQNSFKINSIKSLPNIKNITPLGRKDNKKYTESILSDEFIKNDSIKNSLNYQIMNTLPQDSKKEDFYDITDSNFFKKSRDFIIRDASKKQPFFINASDNEQGKPSSNSTKDFEKDNELGLNLKSLTNDEDIHDSSNKQKTDNKFNRKLITVDSLGNLSSSNSILEKNESMIRKIAQQNIKDNIINNLNQNEVDKIMGAPFIKLKITNINNFKMEPLHKFDKGQIKEEDPAKYYRNGIDKGFSRFLTSERSVEWKACEVVSFNPETQKFTIRWRHNGELKQVSRLNLMFVNEDKLEFENRLRETLDNRYKFLYYNAYKQMLENEAQKSTTLFFPNDQLERILASAFKNITNKDQNELAIRLVDEMLDFYKCEILKFSLELTTLNNDLQQLKELFPHKYFSNILHVPLKDQNKLYIITNIIDKTADNYNNKNINNINKRNNNNMNKTLVSMNSISMKTMNDITNNAQELSKISYMIKYENKELNLFYDMLNKKHKSYCNLNDFYVINCKDITYTNLFQIIHKNMKPKEEIQPNNNNNSNNNIQYINRQMRVEIITIEDINKGKGYIKIKGDRKNAKIIEAWKQSIYRCLPRPISVLAVVKPLIAMSIRSLSELRLFKTFHKMIQSQTFTSIKDIKDIFDKIKEDLMTINNYIYRIEDSLYELRLDIKTKHNDYSDRDDMINQIIQFSNIYLQSCLKTCIKSSLTEAIEDLEKYSAVLPLPYIHDELVENITEEFLCMRARYREKLYLEPEDFNIENQCDINLNLIGEQMRHDKNLLVELTHVILKDLFNGIYHKRDFIQQKKNILMPMFNIKYKLKEKEENKREKHDASKIFMRAKFREKSRENIHEYKQYKQRIIKQQINVDDTCPLDPDLLFEQNNNAYITKQWFGWFKYHGILTEHVPKITEIEENFKKMFIDILGFISSYDYPIKLDSAKARDKNSSIPLYGLEEELLMFRRRFDNIFKFSLMPVLSVFAILHNFEFLILHKKTYFTDLETEFNESKDISMICREIEDLEKDLDFILRKLPNHFNLGFFSLDISDFRKILIKNTQLYLQNFKKFLEQTLQRILDSNEIIAQKNISKLIKGAPTLDDYIELKTFIEGEELQNSIDLMREELQICEIIIEYVEKFNLEYNVSVMELFFHSKSWVSKLITNRARAEKKLFESRPRFMKEISEKNREILKELEIVKDEVACFSNYYDPNCALQYYNSAKTIMTKINSLIDAGDKINKYEEALRFQQTDFSYFKKIKDDFDLYHLLWEFIVDKWIYRSESWMKMEFDKLEIDDMAKIILEGKKLLNMLEDKMRHNVNLRELISSYLKDVNKYAEFLEILQILKNESWKERHWQMLWSEMYPHSTTKFDMKSITLEKLLADKLLTFTSTIFKIFNDAKAEHNIEQEINNIEFSLSSIQIRTQYINISDKHSFCVLRGGPSIVTKLDEHVAMCKYMVSKPENPKTLLEKLMNLEHKIKGVRRLIKLLDRLQKRIFRIYPILKYAEIQRHTTKDVPILFERVKDGFQKRTEFIQKKKKMGGLIQLFNRVNDNIDPNNINASNNGDINQPNQPANLSTTTSPTNNSSSNPSLFVLSPIDEQNGDSIINNLRELLRLCTNVHQSLYGILKYIRNKTPRLYLLSDEHIMGLLASSSSSKDITNQVLKAFKGIKNRIINSQETSKTIITEGFISYFNENIYLNDNISIKLEDYDYSQFFICDLIQEIEIELMKWLKTSFKKSISIYFKNPYDYIGIWKILKAKETIFQIILLLNQIGFYNDITFLIATNNIISDEKNLRLFKDKIYLYKIFIEKHLNLFIEYIKNIQNSDKVTWSMAPIFITQIKYQLDILDYLIDHNVYYMDNFEYLILPKMMIEFKMGPLITSSLFQTTLTNCKNIFEEMLSCQNNNPDFTQLYSQSEIMKLAGMMENDYFNVIMRCFNHRQIYGFELINPKSLNNFIITPCTQRCFVNILSAISTSSGTLMHGPAVVGKSTTIEGLGALLGREIFCLDTFSINHESIIQNLSGMILGGYWIMIKDIQKIRPGLLSLLAESLLSIRNTLIVNEKSVRIGNNVIDLSMIGNNNNSHQAESQNRKSWGLLSTIAVSRLSDSKDINSLPKNLLESFRIVNLAVPHITYILEKHLNILEFINPYETANQIMTLLQFLSDNLENQEFLYKDNITSSDINLEVTSLHQKVTLHDVMHIIEIIQRSRPLFQCLLNQNEDIQELDETLELFHIFEEIFYPRMNPLYRKKLILAFNTIFKKNYAEENSIFKDDDQFQKEFLIYAETKKITKSSHFYEKCYLLNTMLNEPYSINYTSLFNDKPKAIILYGHSGKSRIINAVAEIRARSTFESYCSTYLNIDCIYPPFLFGGKHDKGRYYGILSFLVDQANSSSSIINDFDDDNITSVYSHIVNHGIKDNINRKRDWIIFEGSNHDLTKTRIIIYERILKMLRDGIISSDDGAKKELLSTMTFIFKLDKLDKLSPSDISGLKSIYVPEHLFDIKQEFLNWYTPLMLKAPFYAKNHQLVHKLFRKFIGPIIDYATDTDICANLIYYLGKKYFLYNFTSIFEIFLNEARKADIAFGNITDEEIEKSMQKHGEEKSTRNQGALRGQALYHNPFGAIETTINDIYSIKLTLSQEGNSKQKDEQQKSDNIVIDKQSLMIESLCIFSIIWTIGITFKNHYRYRFSEYFINKIKDYYKFHEHLDKILLNHYVIMSYFNDRDNYYDDRTVFDICYDIYNQQWLLWKDYRQDNYTIITNNLTSLTLPVQELSKFNPQIQRIVTSVKKLSYDKNYQTLIPELGEQLFVITNTTKKLRYFLDYLISYRKPIFVISEHDNGKTFIIRNKLKQLLEMNGYKSISLPINYHTTQNTIMKIVESHAIKNIKEVSSNQEIIIFIDDLHLSSRTSNLCSLFLSFEKQKGWYNHNKNGFIKLNKTAFIYAASHAIPAQDNSNIFKEDCIKYPQPFLKKMNIINMPSMDENDLRTIFREYTEGIMDDIENEQLQKIAQKYFMKLYKFLSFHRMDMVIISKIHNCNYTLNTMLQMIKSMQRINWEGKWDPQKMIDAFYYHLKRAFGIQFLNMKPLPDDLVLFKKLPDQNSSMISSMGRINSNMRVNQEEEEKAERIIIKNETENVRINLENEANEDDSKESIKEQEVSQNLMSFRLSPDHIMRKINQSELDEDLQKEIEPVNEVENEEDPTPKNEENLSFNRGSNNKFNLSFEKNGIAENNTPKKMQSDLIHTPKNDSKTIEEEFFPDKKSEELREKSITSENECENNIDKNSQMAEIPLNLLDNRDSLINNNNNEYLMPGDIKDSLQLTRSYEIENSQMNDTSKNMINVVEVEQIQKLKRKAIVTSIGDDSSNRFKLVVERSSPKYKLPEHISERSESQYVISDKEEESSSDDEEIDQFDIESIDFLRKIPQDYLNYMTKRFLLDRENKITEWIMNGITLPFDMELLHTKTNDTSILSEHNASEFITPYDISENSKFVRFIDVTMKRYISINRSSFMIFNDHTTKSSTLFNDICILLIELYQKHEQLLICSLSHPLYIYHIIKYSTYILNYGFAHVNLTKKNSQFISNHVYFINLLCETLSISLKENKRCVILIEIDTLRDNKLQLSYETKLNICNIFNDLNNIMNYGSIENVIPPPKLQILLNLLKKNIEYDHCSDNHLLYILSQKILLYLKFIIYTDYDSIFNHDINNFYNNHQYHQYYNQYSHNNDEEYINYKDELYYEIMNNDIITLLKTQYHALYSSLKRIVLHEMKFNNNNIRNTLLKENFKLNIHSDILNIIEKNYKIEIELTSIYQKENSQIILPSYREIILNIDFIYHELRNTLVTRIKNNKKTGDILMMVAKKMRKKAHEIEHEINDLKRYNTQRLEEIEKIKINIIDLNQKKDAIIQENKGIAQKIKQLGDDLDGYVQEEIVLKKLQNSLQDVSNQLITYNSKDYPEDIKYGKFIGSKYYNLYSYMFCLIFNIINDKLPIEKAVITPDNEVGINNISTTILESTSKEFTKIFSDYSIFKNYILSFKFNLLNDEKMKILIDILASNNLISLHIKCNRLQKNFMKWIDLIIETSKFELRKEYRVKEIKGIKSIIQNLQEEILTREKLLAKIEEALVEQPTLQFELLDKIHTTEKQINLLNQNVSKLINIYNDLEYISQKNFEINNPMATNEYLYNQYILLISMYIYQCCKYPSKYRNKLYKGILHNINMAMNPNNSNNSPKSDVNRLLNNGINGNNMHIHRILYGERYLSELLKLNIPLCLSMIDNISILDMVTSIDMLVPLIIDNSGLMINYLRNKYTQDNSIIFMNDPNNILTYENAIKNGFTLCIIDFTHDYIDILEPYITYKYNSWMNRIYKKQVSTSLSSFIAETPKRANNNSKMHDNHNSNDRGNHNDNNHLHFDHIDNDNSMDSNDETNNSNQKEEEIEFLGRKIKIHKNFKLILILKNKKLQISKIILEKLFILNNEINDNNTWREVSGDLLLSICYTNEKKNAIDKYFEEKLHNEVNIKFEFLIEKCKKIDFNSGIDMDMLDEIDVLSKNLKLKYNELKTKESMNNPDATPKKSGNLNLIDEIKDKSNANDNNNNSIISNNKINNEEKAYLPPSNQNNNNNNEGNNAIQVNNVGNNNNRLADNTNINTNANTNANASTNINVNANINTNKSATNPSQQFIIKQLDMQTTIIKGSEEGLNQYNQNEMITPSNTNNILDDHEASHIELLNMKTNTSTQFNLSEAKEFFGENDFENNTKDDNDISESLMFLNNFNKLNTIISQHERLLDYLYILRIAMIILDHHFGSLYTFSDQMYLLNISQAMEITILNGHFRIPWRSQGDIMAFEMLVFYNTFHQIYCMLRTDHQTLFTFFFAVLLSKLTGEFKGNIWNLYINGKTHEQVNYLGFENSKEWKELRKLLIDYYAMANDLLPNLRAFQIENLRLLSRLDLNSLMPNANLNQSPESNKTKINLDSNNNSNNVSRIYEGRKNQKYHTLVVNTSSKIGKNDEKLFSNAALTEFDIPKLVNSGNMKIDKEEFENNMDFFSNFASTLQSNQRKNDKTQNTIKIKLHSPGLKKKKSQNPESDINNPSISESPLQNTEEPEIYHFSENQSKNQDGEPHDNYDTNFLVPSTSKSVNPHRTSNLSKFSQTQGSQIIRSTEKSKTQFVNQQIPSDNIKELPPKRDAPPKNRLPINIANFAFLDGNALKSPADSLKKLVHKFQEESKHKKKKTKSNIENTAKEDNIQANPQIAQSVGLINLSKLIPNIRLILNDMEVNPAKWNEFMNRSPIFFTNAANKIFPQMPNHLNDKFNSFEILALVKYIRPDALEFYTRCFLGEIRHKYYYNMPKTNLESHARANWYHRPTVVFYGSEYKNPTEIIELIALRNRQTVYKISVGERPEKDVIEELKKCIEMGSWFILENFHMVKSRNAKIIIKKLEEELEEIYNNDHDIFKIWIMFHIDSLPYNTIKIKRSHRDTLESFFQSCFRIYLSTPSNVKSRMNDYFRPQLYNLFAQVEKEFINEKQLQKENNMNIHKQTMSPENMQKYRQYCQIQKGYIDIHELFEKRLQITGYVEDLAKKINIDSQLMKLRYTMYFLFSVLRQRSTFEEVIVEDTKKKSIIYVSDKDWMENLDDILFYLSQNINKALTLLEKYICYMYDFEYGSSKTFNSITIKQFFRTYIAKNEKMAPIQVKNVYYDMLRENMPTERQIFECFKHYPNHDPIHLFGYNTNHDISYSFQRSKRIYERVLKCEKSINDDQNIILELDEIENRINKDHYEYINLKNIIDKYILDTESKIQNKLEKKLKSIQLIKEIMKIFSEPTEYDKIRILKTVTQDISHYLVKLPDEDNGDLVLLDNEESNPNIHIPNIPIRPKARSQFVFNSPRNLKKSSVDHTSDTQMVSPMKKSGFFAFGNPSKSHKLSYVEPENTQKSNFAKKPSPRKDSSSTVYSLNFDHHPHRNDVFNNLILNEIKEYKKLTRKICGDLISILNYLQGLESVSLTQELKDTWKSIKHNQIPYSWRYLNGIRANCENFYKYLKCYNLKADTLRVLVTTRDCEMYPLIPLDKLFDPIFLIKSAVWNYALQTKTALNEIEIILVKIAQPPSKQIADEGMFINGLRIKAAKYNETNGLIEEESGRQFENRLPSFFMTFNKRTKTLSYSEDDIHIPIYIKPKGNMGVAKFKNDIVSEYLDYIKNYKKKTYEESLNAPVTNIVSPKNTNPVYPIRLPILNPKNENNPNDFGMKFFFYGKSCIPAEFWHTRGTSISLDIYDP